MLGPHPPHAVVVFPPTFPSRVNLRECTFVGRFTGQGVGRPCQHLGNSIFVDAASIGSYAHWPRWIWTNLAPSSTLAATFSAVLPHFDQKVDDILDPNWTSLPVVRDDLPPLALVNKVEAPRRSFMTFPQSFAFHDRGPGMVWDAHTKTHTEPLADE